VIVNKAWGTMEAVYNNNCEPRTTHDNEFPELHVSGRMAVDETDSTACHLSSVNSVHTETQDYFGVTSWTTLDTSVDIGRPRDVNCSTPTGNTSSVLKVTGVPAMLVLEGQDKSKYLSTRLGRVVGLPRQFLSLSGWKEVTENCQGHIHKSVDSGGANLFEQHRSNREEHLDLASLSSFKRIAENHSNFVPYSSNRSLFGPKKDIEFRNYEAGVSYLPAGLTLDFMYSSWYLVC
jgi:hypothetical protein